MLFTFCPHCGNKLKTPEVSFRCDFCGRSYYANSKPTATVVPIAGKKILLGIRGKDPHKGKLDFIGGFLDYGEDPLDGAVREFREETGVMIDKNDLTFFGIYMDSYIFEEVEYQLLNVIYTHKTDEPFSVTAADDVESLEWVALKKSIPMAFEHQNEVIAELCSKKGL